MQILKIENGTGNFFSRIKGEFTPIDKIDKDDLLDLLNATLEEDVEMDNMEEKSISHQAHAIIYKSIYDKLLALSENKSRFKDERDRTYLEEIKKYSV